MLFSKFRYVGTGYNVKTLEFMVVYFFICLFWRDLCNAFSVYIFGYMYIYDMCVCLCLFLFLSVDVSLLIRIYVIR